MRTRPPLGFLLALLFPGIALGQPLESAVVVTERVTFESEGVPLVGTLYLPDPLPDAPAPAVVVTGSWTTVKEQMAGRYARQMAQRGFPALAFDFRYWGESGGEPRQFESPEAKIADIQAAVGFLQTRPEIDPNRIGGLGVCASAGYLAHAVAADDRLKAFATVSAWMHDEETVASLYGGAARIDSLVAVGREARQAFEQRGEASYVPAYDPDDPAAAMSFELEYYGSADRGDIPAWTNRFAEMSWAGWLTFDALAAAPEIDVPVLLIHSDGAWLPENVRRFYDTVPTDDKDLYWSQGFHTDFYDLAPYVDEAAGVAALLFHRALAE